MRDDDVERFAWRLSQGAEGEIGPSDARTVLRGGDAIAMRDARELIAWARRNEGL